MRTLSGDTSGMSSMLSRLMDAYRAVGWRLPAVALGWGIRPRYLVLVRDLAQPLPAIPPRPDLRWTLCTEHDIAAVCALGPLFSEREVRQRLAEGQEADLAWAGDRLVYCRWETTQPSYLPFIGLRVQPLPGDICGAGSFTPPELRGQGLHTLGTAIMLRRSQARGLRRNIALIAPWNRPSLRVGQGKMQRQVVGSIGYWNAGLWRRYVAEGRVRLDGHGSFLVEP